MRFILPLASSIRSDPLVDTLIKVLIVVVIGAVAWWLIGVIAGETNPPNPFIRIARILVAVIVAVIVIVLLLRLL